MRNQPIGAWQVPVEKNCRRNTARTAWLTRDGALWPVQAGAGYQLWARSMGARGRW